MSSLNFMAVSSRKRIAREVRPSLVLAGAKVFPYLHSTIAGRNP